MEDASCSAEAATRIAESVKGRGLARLFLLVLEAPAHWGGCGRAFHESPTIRAEFWYHFSETRAFPVKWTPILAAISKRHATRQGHFQHPLQKELAQEPRP